MAISRIARASHRTSGRHYRVTLGTVAFHRANPGQAATFVVPAFVILRLTANYYHDNGLSDPSSSAQFTSVSAEFVKLRINPYSHLARYRSCTLGVARSASRDDPATGAPVAGTASFRSVAADQTGGALTEAGEDGGDLAPSGSRYASPRARSRHASPAG